MHLMNEKYSFLEEYLDFKIDHPIDGEIKDERDQLKYFSHWIKSHEEILRRFLYKSLYRRTEKLILLNYRLDKNNIEPEENIYAILSGRPEETDKIVNVLEKDIGLSLPNQIMPIKNLIISILMYICSLAFIIYFFSLHSALFSAFPTILLWILFISTAGLPNVILLLINPNFYKPVSFYKIRTFHDFIDRATYQNLIYVEKEENSYIEEELNYLLSNC